MNARSAICLRELTTRSAVSTHSQWVVISRPVDIPQRRVGEYSTRTVLVGSSSSGDDGNNGTDHLGQRQSRTHVQSRQGLEKDHAETDTLDSIEHTEPKPQACTPKNRPRRFGEQARRSEPERTPRYLQVGSSNTSPRDVKTDSRNTPPHLTPSWTTETDSEDRKQPRVDLRVVCMMQGVDQSPVRKGRRSLVLTNQKTHQKSPDSDKEDGNHDDDRPSGYLYIAPEISPVSSTMKRDTRISYLYTWTRPLESTH